MDWNFGVMELIFLVSCVIIFLRRRSQISENEIDGVKMLKTPDEQVKSNKNMDILVCRTEVFDNQIFVYNRKTDAFITQQPTIESIFMYFIDNYPGRRIHFGEE